MRDHGSAKSRFIREDTASNADTYGMPGKDIIPNQGKRSWKLFYDTVPNAKEILESAASYRDAK